MPGSKKRWLIAGFSLIYIAAIFWLVDIDDVIGLLPKVPASSIVLATLLAILAHVFALARSASALKAFGFSPPWRDILLAFAAGNLTTLALNVVGQSLSRAMVLQGAGVPFGVSVLATYVERLLAAGVLFIASLAAVWLLFSRLVIDLNEGIGDLIVAGVAIVIVATAVALLVFGETARQGAAAAPRLLFRLAPSTIWTALGHLAGLGTYLVLFESFNPGIISLHLVAALTIVLLATSLPISFAGFGLRELSAAATLSLIGVEPQIAVAAAVLVGLIYILVAGIIGISALPLLRGAQQSRQAEGSQSSTPTSSFSLTDSMIVQALAVACAVLLFFRVRAPFASRDVLININVADLLIFIALTVIVLMLATGRLRCLFPPAVMVAIAALSGAIAIGLVGSYIFDVLGGWALYTRGVGWIVLLGCLSLGAAATRLGGERARMLLAQSLIVAALTVCALQFLGLLVGSYIPLPHYVIRYPLQGFANNQNAFCFELAITGVLLIAAKNRGAFRNAEWIYLSGMVAIAAAVFLTESRSGAVFILILAALDLTLTRSRSGDCARPAPSLTAAIAFGLMMLIVIPMLIPKGLITPPSAPQVNAPSLRMPIFSGVVQYPRLPGATRLSHPQADTERWDTIKAGLTLWKEHPTFGAGIGAYFESLRRKGKEPKGIHSVYVWFLAEMGAVGLLALLSAGGLLVYSGWTAFSTQHRQWGFTALGCLACMGIGGLVQDFSYQRIFWFVLGLSIARPPTGDQGSGSVGDRVFIGIVVGLAGMLLILASV